MKHQLYKTGDHDAPEQIQDRNGHVVLSMCRVCGLAEIELNEQPDCVDPVLAAERHLEAMGIPT